MFHLLQGLHALLQWVGAVDDHLELPGIDHAAKSVQYRCTLRSDDVDRSDAALGQLRAIDGIDCG